MASRLLRVLTNNEPWERRARSLARLPLEELLTTLPGPTRWSPLFPCRCTSWAKLVPRVAAVAPPTRAIKVASIAYSMRS